MAIQFCFVIELSKYFAIGHKVKTANSVHNGLWWPRRVVVIVLLVLVVLDFMTVIGCVSLRGRGSTGGAGGLLLLLLLVWLGSKFGEERSMWVMARSALVGDHAIKRMHLKKHNVNILKITVPVYEINVFILLTTKLVSSYLIRKYKV